MISHLSGTLLSKSTGSVVIEASGIGYKVSVSTDTLASIAEAGIGAQISLWTYLAVRENAMDLYGFLTQGDLSFFELLLGVPGIGPKSAIAILSLATVDVLEKSISSGDITYLTKVSGIGKKSAEKIVLELKDKMLGDTTGEGLRDEADAVDALRSLGYSLKESREALQKVDGETTGTGERVRAALKLLGNGS